MNPFARGRGSSRTSSSTATTSDSSPLASPQSPSNDNANGNGNVVRIMSPAGERLSIIMENGHLAPPPRIPPRSPNRLRPSSTGSIGQATFGSTGATTLTPDEKIKNWSIWSDDGRDEIQPPLGPFARLRQNRHIARRGGWKRLGLCILLFLVVIAAIIVGVLLGTRRHRKSSDQQTAQSQNSGNPGSTTTVWMSSPANPSATGVPSSTPSSGSASTSSPPAGFPLGTYTINTFLDTVTTDCTSNPATWTCFPYSIYSQSPAKSLTTFNWIVSQTNNKKLSISSTSNPFAIDFNNAPLTLVDSGQPTERYKFQVMIDKEVRPAAALTSDGAATTCFYNSTTFIANLYTKVNATYPSDSDGSAAAASSANTFPAWPYEVHIEQSIGGGSGVPTCYKTTNGMLGDRVPVDSGDATALCSCLYLNVYNP